MAVIWAYPTDGKRHTAAPEGRMMLRLLSDGRVRLELEPLANSNVAQWAVELTLDECQEIADAIGRRSRSEWPQGGEG